MYRSFGESTTCTSVDVGGEIIKSVPAILLYSENVVIRRWQLIVPGSIFCWHLRRGFYISNSEIIPRCDKFLHLSKSIRSKVDLAKPCATQCDGSRIYSLRIENKPTIIKQKYEQRQSRLGMSSYMVAYDFGTTPPTMSFVWLRTGKSRKTHVAQRI